MKGYFRVSNEAAVLYTYMGFGEAVLNTPENVKLHSPHSL